MNFLEFTPLLCCVRKRGSRELGRYHRREYACLWRLAVDHMSRISTAGKLQRVKHDDKPAAGTPSGFLSEAGHTHPTTGAVAAQIEFRG